MANKKMEFCAILIALLVLLFAGCGGSSDSNKDTTAKWGSAVWGQDKWNE